MTHQSLTKVLTSNNEEQDDKKLKSVYKNQLKNTEQLKTNLEKNPELKSKSYNKPAIETFEDLIKTATK